MAYQYSNPYQTVQQPALQSPAPRSTFGSAINAPQGCQVLFGGLPPDVKDSDLRELLINPPLALAATSTTVKPFYNAQGQFTGSALVSVSNAEDAERIRVEYSGQNIDNTYRLSVQHLLPPTHSLPPKSVTPFTPTATTSVPPAAPRAARAAVAPASNTRQAAARTPVKTPAALAANQRAPGMALLSRMKGSGGPSTAQAALLAKQKANLSKANSSLISRIAKASPARKVITQVAAGQQQARKASASQAARTARTKAASASASASAASSAVGRSTGGGMDVDKSTPAGPGASGKGKGKEQAKANKTPNAAALDEEMRLYERQKRFAA